MNTRQLQYAIELSKSLNMSLVAERFGISQPALSKQILNLEKELDVKLFDRSTIPLTITPAGAHFFSKAEKLLYEEDQLLKSMQDFKTGKKGRLVIGISPFRSLYLIPPVVKKVKDKYPDVNVVLREASSDELRKEIAEGKYDFAIVNLPVDEAILDIKPLEADTVVLAVPKDMVKALPETAKIDIKECGDIPFIVEGQGKEMRNLFDKCCAGSGYEPIISAEVVGLATAYSLCRAGVGATLLPLQFVESMGKDNIALYHLKHTVNTRKPAVVLRKGQYISEYAKYATELLTQKG